MVTGNGLRQSEIGVYREGGSGNTFRRPEGKSHSPGLFVVLSLALVAIIAFSARSGFAEPPSESAPDHPAAIRSDVKQIALPSAQGAVAPIQSLLTIRTLLPIISLENRQAFRRGILPSSELFTQANGDPMPHYALVRDMNFKWIKIYLSWRSSEQDRGQYHFEGIDYRLNQAIAMGLKVLLIVEDSPTWASGSGNSHAPPNDVAAFGEFMYQAAAHFRGRVGAYEIWNEPNTSGGFGGVEPNAQRYVGMLRAVHPRIKAADPNALVISGGLANTGDGTPGNQSDQAFIQGMVSAGGAQYFDALGIHPYGGPYAPETPHSQADMGTFFRRAEENHAQLVSVLGYEKPLWATEFGYLIDPAIDNRPFCLDPHFTSMVLTSEEIQADYLERAYLYAEKNWPWLEMLMVNSLDLNLDPWRNWNDCDPLMYYAIMRPDKSLRPAYYRLRDLAIPRGLGPQ